MMHACGFTLLLSSLSQGDGYRPPFSNAPNSGYGQNQFNTTRDYPNSTYQRVRAAPKSVNN